MVDLYLRSAVLHTLGMLFYLWHLVNWGKLFNRIKKLKNVYSYFKR